MKEISVILLTFYSWLSVPTYSFAQQQNTPCFEVGISGIFFYDGLSISNWGGGITAKFLKPVEKNNNYFTYGIAYDLLIDSYPGYKPDLYHFINATGGYRMMINSFFIEPQLGLGIIKVYYQNYPEPPGFGALFGIESGFHVNNFTISFNPRLMMTIDIFGGDVYSYLGLKGAIRLGRKNRY